MIISIERISRRYERNIFRCGVFELDQYLHKFAMQNDKKGLGVTYVAVDSVNRKIIGYYTLSTGNIEHTIFPDDTARKLPRYPIPSILLARLAVDQQVQEKGIGKSLLIHAMKQALKAGKHVGWYVMTVDAIDQRAIHFYKYFGFRALVDDKRHLFMPMKRIENLFEA